MERRIACVSMNRYNGGVRAKRAYGSSTITEFWVFYSDTPDDYKKYEVGGKTPSERKKKAIEMFVKDMEKSAEKQ